jgi:hypothetical protein
MIAAFGPRMLRLTARWADVWNSAWYGAPDDRVHQRMTQLDEALAAEGRDPASLARTLGLSVRDPEQAPSGEDPDFAGPVEELSEVLDAYASMAIAHVMVLLQPLNERSLDRLAEAVSRRRG